MIDIRPNARPGGPLVTLLMATYNRRAYLAEALASAVGQTWRNLQILLVRDGGEDVRDIVERFDDPRIHFIDRAENRGYAATLNEALQYAEGKYLAYLGDDDFHYPDHVESLVTALEGSDYGAAYTDLYRTTFKLTPDGRRVALGKYLDIRRNFDRIFMFHFNQALGGALMHRRDLLDRTGGYNEEIGVLVDWDMTRRLAFYTDFLHVERITGEYCVPHGESDRISTKGRKDPAKFRQTVTRIRTTRPPKPWPKVPDLSIIYVADRMSRHVAEALGRVWNFTFYPYKLYLPLPEPELAQLDWSDLPTFVPVPVAPTAPPDARVDAALEQCEGEMVAIVPHGMPIDDVWVEDPLCALMRGGRPGEGILLDGRNTGLWGAVFRRDELQAARRRRRALPLRASLRAEGLIARPARGEELPFQVDGMLDVCRKLKDDGDWRRAARLYDKMRTYGAGEAWMREEMAKALIEADVPPDRVLGLCETMNRQAPSVESLLAEAKLRRKADQSQQAAELLEHARGMLQWKGQA